MEYPVYLLDPSKYQSRFFTKKALESAYCNCFQ